MNAVHGRLLAPVAFALAGAFGVAPRGGRVLAATAAAAALAWRPELVAAAGFFAIEELASDSKFLERAPAVLVSGGAFYRTTVAGIGLPLLVLLAAIAASVARRSLHRAPPVAVWTAGGVLPPLAALAAWSAMLSVLQEDGGLEPAVVSRAVTAATPWLVAGAAYVLGRLAMAPRPGRPGGGVLPLELLLGVVVVVKAVMGVLLELAGMGVTIDDQRFVIFYDASLPAAAAALVLGRLFVSRTDLPTVWTLVLGASAVVVLLSFRRSVWLLMAVALLAAPVVARRSAVARRVAVVVAVSVLALPFLPASIRGAATERMAGVAAAVRGEAGNRESAAQHIDDVTRGLELVREAPLLGIGVRAEQPVALSVAPEADQHLYVHNEYLQTWLRYGIPGLAGLLLLLLRLFRSGVRVLGRRTEDPVLAAAAVFVATIGVPIFTAAFLTTTYRFPFLLGLAAAVVDARADRPPSPPAPPTRRSTSPRPFDRRRRVAPLAAPRSR